MRGWLVGVLLAALAAATAGAAEKQMCVQIRDGQIRGSPSFMGAVTATCPYAARVVVLAEQGSWLRVRAVDGGAEGWMHTSALTPKRIVMKATGDTTGGVSSDEVALAGKGFTPEVEKEFKGRNKQADFATIDRMEKIRIPAQEREKFLRAAGLGSEGGAR